MIPRRAEKIKFFLSVVIPVVKTAFVPFSATGEIPQTQVSQGFATFRLILSRIQPRHSQSKCATNCANPGYEIQTDPTAGCSNSGVCLQMATPQNLTAVHVACRKRTECRRKTILYFTEICRKVKSYHRRSPVPLWARGIDLSNRSRYCSHSRCCSRPNRRCRSSTR